MKSGEDSGQGPVRRPGIGFRAELSPSIRCLWPTHPSRSVSASIKAWTWLPPYCRRLWHDTDTESEIGAESRCHAAQDKARNISGILLSRSILVAKW